jgi:hypothetical protein
MARIDKSDPMTSTFRVDVAADFLDANIGKLFGWGLDSSGKAVIGAGQTGIIGVWVVNDKPGRVGPLREVPRIDIMRAGCVTDFGPTTGTPGVNFGVAGTKYFALTNGNIQATPVAGAVLVGQTVEPDRLEVHVVPNPLITGQYGL